MARLLYPDLYKENWRKAYDRIIKNLQSLRKSDLLKYKDYGLGKDNLWALKPHSIIRELGYFPPRAEIHTFKYEHEKTCADVFVTLALSGNLTDWQEHKKINKGIIPDRIADFNGTVYIEVEMGSQNKIKQKADSYKKYFQETRQPFEVWFLLNEMRQLERAQADLATFPSHYKADLLTNFHASFTHTEENSVSDTLSDSLSD
ncbi:MAG: hypothetical protein ACR2N3_04785 [Pyrinomonadaceae bacterium]